MDDREQWIENLAAYISEHHGRDADEARAFVREYVELLERSKPTDDMFELIYQQEADRLYEPGSKGVSRSALREACVERIAELTRLAMLVSLEDREDEEEAED